MDEQGQDEPTYSSCVDTGCSPEDLSEAMDDSEGAAREGQGYLCWWRDMMMMIKEKSEYKRVKFRLKLTLCRTLLAWSSCVKKR